MIEGRRVNWGGERKSRLMVEDCEQSKSWRWWPGAMAQNRLVGRHHPPTGKIAANQHQQTPAHLNEFLHPPFSIADARDSTAFMLLRRTHPTLGDVASKPLQIVLPGYATHCMAL